MGCALIRNETDAATDLIIVGAGPAGIAAAIEAVRWGVRTLVLDENPAAGGRVWQALEARGGGDADEDAALAMIHALAACEAAVRHGASVWGMEPDGTVFWTEGGAARSMRARRILLATGTTERPMPIPGWTRPGVMTVGAAQIALKTGGLLPDGNTWIAGQGPLTLLYAVQAIRAGGKLAGILDLGDRGARFRALPFLPRAIADARTGLGWAGEIKQAGIPRYRATDLRADGDGPLSKISFRIKGAPRTEPADLLLLHNGVIPSIQITRALGCDHTWDERQHSWRPETNAWGETTVPGIIVAGDGARVGGAAASVFAGRIAALGCAHALARIDIATRDREAAPVRAGHARAIASRPFIDTLFAPPRIDHDDATLICRCEEVTAGQIREAVKLGCPGLNQLKAFTRCGMGPCQGRMCGPSAAEVMAGARGLHPRAIEPFRTRFPARPLTVGELAKMR
jgi:NADPH-dependent 2,4-dienoyl-CoA reductase/sulfur reductase-like enzyme